MSAHDREIILLDVLGGRRPVEIAARLIVSSVGLDGEAARR